MTSFTAFLPVNFLRLNEFLSSTILTLNYEEVPLCKLFTRCVMMLPSHSHHTSKWDSLTRGQHCDKTPGRLYGRTPGSTVIKHLGSMMLIL